MVDGWSIRYQNDLSSKSCISFLRYGVMDHSAKEGLKNLAGRRKEDGAMKRVLCWRDHESTSTAPDDQQCDAH